MYKIKYYYRTGDSFHSEDKEDILEYEWEDLDIAKESLQRIKEHYRWYDSIENSFIMETEKKPHWFNVKYDKREEHYLINLRLDNRKDVQFRPPWCGYFESLYGAEIILEDKDMKFEF